MLAGTAAKLLASLELDTKPFEAGARRAGGAIGQMESRFAKIGGIAQRGLANAANNIKRLGLAAAGFIGANVVQGVRSLQDLERVTNATKGVIESTGGAAGVSAEQVRRYAQELENLTTADDKAIQEGQNMLLTFTSIGKEVFPRATKAVTDLAIAMADGNVENADFSRTAIQVGKALNDPIRGVTALRRVGVQFNDQQAKRIEQLVEEGKLQEAQVLILQELEKEFGKAGEAAGQGFGADMRRAQDAIEDAQQALATGFLPLIRRASNFLSTELAKPEVLARIREFGDGLAKGFDQALTFAQSIPWSTIGDALRIGGEGAKAVLGAFSAMPDWVKTAVITGWGLNKLTGGAVSGIVGELGKGLIKGVLGINAGVVNIKAGAVAGGGAGAAVAAKGGISTLGKLFLVGEAIGLVAAVLAVKDAVNADTAKQAQDIHTVLTDSLAGKPTIAELGQKLAGIDQGIREFQNNPFLLIAGEEALRELVAMRTEVVAAIEEAQSFNQLNEQQKTAINVATDGFKGIVDAIQAADKASSKNLQPLPKNITDKQKAKFDALRERTEANRIAIVTEGGQTQGRLDAARAAITASQAAARVAMVIAQANAATRIVSAIQAIQAPVVIVNTDVNVSGNNYTSNSTVKAGGKFGNKQVPNG